MTKAPTRRVTSTAAITRRATIVAAAVAITLSGCSDSSTDASDTTVAATAGTPETSTPTTVASTPASGVAEPATTAPSPTVTVPAAVPATPVGPVNPPPFDALTAPAEEDYCAWTRYMNEVWVAYTASPRDPATTRAYVDVTEPGFRTMMRLAPAELVEHFEAALPVYEFTWASLAEFGFDEAAWRSEYGDDAGGRADAEFREHASTIDTHDVEVCGVPRAGGG